MATLNVSLAPTGSSGNNTHAATSIPQYAAVAFQFVVETAGATPTITYKFQGSLDGTNWYDVAYTTDASDTISQATRTATAVGAQASFADVPAARHYTQFRCVTSANTNITYRAEAWANLSATNE